MGFAAVSIVAVLLAADETAQPVPFKLGRFSHSDRMFLGIVVDDRTVAQLPSSAGSSLKGVIANYANLRATLIDLAAKARSGKGPGIYELKSLDTLPPIPDPQNMLNAAVNYVEHGNEMARAGGAAPACRLPSVRPLDRVPTANHPLLGVRERLEAEPLVQAVRIPRRERDAREVERVEVGQHEPDQADAHAPAARRRIDDHVAQPGERDPVGHDARDPLSADLRATITLNDEVDASLEALWS